MQPNPHLFCPELRHHWSVFAAFMWLGGFPEWSCIFWGSYINSKPLWTGEPLWAALQNAPVSISTPFSLGIRVGYESCAPQNENRRGSFCRQSPHLTRVILNHPKHTPVLLLLLFSPEHPHEEPCRATFHDKILHLTLDPCSVWTEHVCRSELQHRKTCLCWEKVVGGWTSRLGNKGKQKISERGEYICRTGLVQHLCSERSEQLPHRHWHHPAEVRRAACS